MLAVNKFLCLPKVQDLDFAIGLKDNVIGVYGEVREILISDLC